MFKREMQHKPPPNYKAVMEAFPAARSRDVVFAYAPHIYNPKALDLPDAILVHERIHLRQQKDVGGPEQWWAWYLQEPRFRLGEELEAHAAEAAIWCTEADNRAERRRIMVHMGRKLASPIYGSLVRASTATKMIKEMMNAVHSRSNPDRKIQVPGGRAEVSGDL